MHSLTYTQKSCRQNAGSRDAYVYMRTFFATHKLQRADQRAESKKNAYTIYTLNIHFLYSKSAYTIYTRNHISSRQQYFQRPSHYSPTPQICRQQAEIGQITTNHYCSSTPHAYPHFAGNRIKHTTQQSQATARPQQHGKKVHTHPAAGIHIFFRPLFPLPSKRQTGSIHPTGEEKREKGV